MRAVAFRPAIRPQFLGKQVPRTLLASGISPIRFNSSSTVSEIKTELTSFADPANANPHITDLTSDQYGYLDSIGMAQGFGPTALVERLLELTHVYTGLPWWGTIAVATLMVRVVLFPLYVKSSANAAKMSHAKPELDQLTKDLRNSESTQETATLTRKRQQIMKKYDIKTLHSLAPLAQLPLAYGFFQGLRKMANFPVEGFSTQGYAWFPDLTQVDPYCGLQGIAAGVVIGMIKLGGETGAQVMSPAMKKLFTFIPIVSILVTKDLSAAVVLYFAVNATFSTVQAFILRNKYFKKWANIPDPAKPQVVAGAEKQPETIKEWFQQTKSNMDKDVGRKMKESNQKVGAIQRRKAGSQSQFIKRH